MSGASAGSSPVVVDADGVVFDFIGTLVRHARDELGLSLQKRNDAYWPTERFGITSRELDHLLQTFPWDQCLAIDGALDSLSALCSDHEVVIVTGIEGAPLEQRRAQFASLGFADLSVHGAPQRKLGKRGFTQDKRDVFRSLKPTAVIDDQLNNLRAAHEVGVPRRLWIKIAGTQDPEGVHHSEIPGLVHLGHLREAVGHLLVPPPPLIPSTGQGSDA